MSALLILVLIVGFAALMMLDLATERRAARV